MKKINRKQAFWKAIAVIRSCTTLSQLETAERFAKLVCSQNRIYTDGNDTDLFDIINRNYKCKLMAIDMMSELQKRQPEIITNATGI